MSRVFAILAIACGLLSSAFGAGLTAYDLEVEARSNPTGIDTLRPRLGWKLRSSIRGDKQTAYQIRAASSRELLEAGKADLWDSGRVKSEESTWIPYGGVAFRSFQTCWWQVRVWDANGNASNWTEPARWTAAVIDAKDWHASWIAEPDTVSSSGAMPIFRKQISLERRPRRALALIAGYGFNELRINGAKVGDHVLAPAWTNYRRTALYETFDVTSMLRSGDNALGIMLGNGFFNVTRGRYTKYTGSFGRPRLYMQLHLEFDDGSTRDIVTDASWKTHSGPITFSSIYGGEDFDARLEPDGWDRAGFNDSAWTPAAVVDGPGGALTAQSSQPVRVQQTFTPVKVTQPKPGVFVYDLGQNFAGWPSIEASGAAGARIKLKPGELLDKDGLVTQRSSGGPAYFSYILKSTGREFWSPRFSYYGFRYVQVEGAAPESSPIAGLPVLHRVEGQFVHLDAPRAGTFHSSSEQFNRIHALIDAAVRSNMQHVLTDCPHREKLGWLEQTYLMGPSLLYGWDLRALLPKVMRDIRNAQTPDGLVPEIAPEYVVFHFGNDMFRDSPEWGSAAIFLPWMAWQWYGDRKPLEDSYESMKRYAGYLAGKARDGILSQGLGDWYDIGPGAPGPSKLTPNGVTATATYIASLNILERAARLLGKDSDAREFAQQEVFELGAFQTAFYDASKQTYSSGSQTALAMPLALGIAPEAVRAKLIEQLVEDIRRHDNHTTAGDIGYRYVVRALLDAGRSDVLFDMASRTDNPSYGAQLGAGATALTEAWDANPLKSQNHLMLGHIEEWFYAGLAGIRPHLETPGLRRVDIRPEVVGNLASVDATWQTFRGPVKVQWKLEGDTLHLAVELPPGMSSHVFLSAASPDQVRESGARLAKAAGITLLKPESGRTVVQIGSGRYDFRIRGIKVDHSN